MLYFIQRQDEPEFIKIGYARDPIARIKQLQVGSPAKLVVIDIVRGSKSEEAGLHKRLRAKGKLASGEWFRYDPEVQEILDSYARGSLRQTIEREEALRRAGLILADMSKNIKRLQRVLSKKR